MNKELFKAIEIEPDHEVLGELFLSLGKVRHRDERSSLTRSPLLVCSASRHWA